MGFTEEVFEGMVNNMSPHDLQTLLDHDKIWKIFMEKAGLSRDEAKKLHDHLKQHRANETIEDKIMLQEDNLARKKLLEVFPKVKAEIQSCIEKLRALAERVDKVHKDCTISSVVTSSVGAFSGVLSITGLILAPFTAGSSLLLSAAGSGLGAATAVSGVTTTAIEHSDTSSAEAEAKSILSASEVNLKRLLETKREKVFNYFKNRGKFMKNMKHMVSSIIALRRALADPALAQDAMRFTSTGGLSAHRAQQVKRAFKGTALSMTKTARIGAAGIRSFFLGLNVYNIVKDSQHLQEGAKAPLAEELRQKAQELGEELEELKEILGLCS